MFNCNSKFNKKFHLIVNSCLSKKNSAILLLIDLTNSNKFKTLYGHDFTESIINNILQQLTIILPNRSLISSIDNEYIGLVLIDYPIDLIERLVNKIYNCLQLFCSPSFEQPVQIKATISSVNIPTDSTDPEDALQKAYLISKNSKFDENKFYFPYTNLQKDKEIYKQEFILSSNLKTALIENRLRLAYQPIINSKNGLISHYECLLRIITKEGKIVSAGSLIPIAEEMGFINLIDELVLDLVIEELKNNPNISLAFNLSTIGVYNNLWFDKSQKLLQDSNLSSRLIIEITETAAHKDLSKAAYFIAALQELGCRVALDDFGSGHTSFRQLKSLPVDIIKIDGSFIKDIVDNTESFLFVKTLIDMCQAIGFKSIAEFVENGEIAKLLLTLNVDYMQGNYFCPSSNYRSWNNDF